MEKLSVYVAGPITGLPITNVITRFRDRKVRLENVGYFVYCPILEFEVENIEKLPEVITGKSIVGRDKWMVRKADILLADFTDCQKVVSIGTCMEIAWARELDKLVIAVIPPGNIHNHDFITESCDSVFSNIKDAIKYLENFVSFRR